MPTVEFKGRTVECEEGATLRDVLREAGVSPLGKGDYVEETRFEARYRPPGLHR